MRKVISTCMLFVCTIGFQCLGQSTSLIASNNTSGSKSTSSTFSQKEGKIMDFIFKIDNDNSEVELTAQDALALRKFLSEKSEVLQCDDTNIRVYSRSGNIEREMVSELANHGYIVFDISCHNFTVEFILGKAANNVPFNHSNSTSNTLDLSKDRSSQLKLEASDNMEDCIDCQKEMDQVPEHIQDLFNNSPFNEPSFSAESDRDIQTKAEKECDDCGEIELSNQIKEKFNNEYKGDAIDFGFEEEEPALMEDVEKPSSNTKISKEMMEKIKSLGYKGKPMDEEN